MDDFFIVDKNVVEYKSSDEDVSEDQEEEDDDTDEEATYLNPMNIKNTNKNVKSKTAESDDDDVDLERFEHEMGWRNKKRKKPIKAEKALKAVIENEASIDKILKKSVIKPGFERYKRVPQYNPSDKKLKLRRKRQREKTAGKNWYNLPATEITEEVKNDLEVLQMRSALDPKHFYKKNDMKVLPKYFHIGKVVDSPLDYYNNRLTKKERKRTIVDELMADAEFSKYNKRKYKEIIDEKQKTHHKAHQRAKKLKKKKKN